MVCCFVFCVVLCCFVLCCVVFYCIILYYFFFCFKCQHGAISGNGRYCSKLHPPLSSSQSTRIVPSNRNMSHFTTPSHRHDMRGFPAFPPPYFVLNPVPPQCPIDDYEYSDLIPASQSYQLLPSVPGPRSLCRIQIGDHWATTGVLLMFSFQHNTPQQNIT